MRKNNELIVACGNPFFESRKNYTEIQRKLLYIAISQLKPQLGSSTNESEFYEITIPKRKIINFLNEAYYSTLKDICCQMASKTVVIKDNPEEEEFYIATVFSRIRFDRKGLTFKFNEDMRPFLLDLKEKFATTPLLKILALESNYAIALYELVVANHWKHQFDISIDDLKKFLCVEHHKSYERLDNFKRKCLDLPLKDLNEKLNDELSVSYTTIKAGRKVVGFRFHIKDKKELSKQDTPAPIQTSFRLGLYARELVFLTATSDAKHRFTEKSAAKLCDKYPDEKAIALAIEAVKEQRYKNKDLQITAGMLTKAIQNSWIPNSRYRTKKIEEQFSMP